MPSVGGDVECRHLLIGDTDRLAIAALIQFATDRQVGLGCCGGDEVKDGEPADERLAAPSLGDVAEHALLDLVPMCAAETCEERSNAPKSYGS